MRAAKGYECPKCKGTELEMPNWPSGYPIVCLSCGHKKNKPTKREQGNTHSWYVPKRQD